MKTPQKLSRSQCITSFSYTLCWEKSLLEADMEIESFFYPESAPSLEHTNSHKDYVELIDEDHRPNYLNSLQFLDKSEWLITAYKLCLNFHEHFWVLDMSRVDEGAESGKALGWLNFYLEIDALAKEVLPFRKPFL